MRQVTYRDPPAKGTNPAETFQISTPRAPSTRAAQGVNTIKAAFERWIANAPTQMQTDEQAAAPSGGVAAGCEPASRGRTNNKEGDSPARQRAQSEGNAGAGSRERSRDRFRTNRKPPQPAAYGPNRGREASGLSTPDEME